MNTTIETKACADCTHWNARSSTEGECRRHAPQTIAFEVDDTLRVESRFPATAATDWCGDFEPKR